MRKRLLSALLAAALLFPALSAGADEAARIPVAEQSAPGGALNTAKAYLEGVGLSTAFVDTEQVTRGALVKMLVQLARQSEAPSGNVFTDVSENSDYAGAVGAAYQLKWVEGSGGRLFRPDDAATVMEAVKMTVDMLGYRAYANLQGGYPTGYLVLANRCDLLSGIGRDTSRTLTGQDAALLLANALTAPIAEETGFGGSIRYESNGGTLLSQRYNLVQVEGKITATEYASYGSETHRAKEGCVELEGTPYQIDGDTANLLGLRVIGYVPRDERTTLSFVVPWRNESVTVWAEDIDRMENFTLYLADETEYDIDRSVSVLYNGKAYNGWSEADFSLGDGYVTLLDNNRDGSYDLAFLTDVHYAELTSVDDLNRVLFGKDGVQIDTGDKNAHFRLHSWDGETLEDASIDAFAAGDVIGFAVSMDGLLGTVWHCTNQVSGTVTEQFDDSERQISIDGTPYRISADLLARSGNLLKQSGTFTLGIDGAVAAASAETSGASYGYVIDVMREQSLSGNLLVKALTQNNGVVTLTLDEKCRIDGERNTTKLENAIAPGGTAARQLVKYTMSSDGKTVMNIDTEAKQTTAETPLTKQEDELICYVKGLSSPVKSGNRIFSHFIASAGTQVFVVPQPSAAEVTDEDFAAVSFSYFANDVTYTVDAYDLDSNGSPQMIVCYGKPDKTVSDRSGVAVINRISSVDPGDRDVQEVRVTLWMNGSFQPYYLKDEVSLSFDGGKQAGSGDVVRVEISGDVITALSVDFDASEMAFTSAGSSFAFGDRGYNRLISYVMGMPYKRMGSQIFYSAAKGPNGYEFAVENLRPLQIGGARCVKVNRRTGQVKPILSNEIYDYQAAGNNASEMLVMQQYWACSLVVVYE